ncbi:SH3 domain-containing protein [Alkalimonas collagenimarina]|uniref:SH3 domain-containing protein n=1 Tax=Alkalimonas collagenimarina TaxID=400390 RepID=A0ABT9H2D1_9GAMM|nr:SH3 domain-containing protein [Alkalimonas collagenimarina]MDP4537477.1 SH3 domain-containing protein [Alkalimonas collagenimarina]
MAENKSNELTEAEDLGSPERSETDLSQYLSHNKGLGVVTRPAAIGRALESFSSQQRAIDSVMAAVARPAAIGRALESFSSQQRAIDSVMAAVARPAAIGRALESLSSQQRLIDSVMAAVARPAAIGRALESLSSQQRLIDSVIAAVARPAAIGRALESFSSQHRAIDNAIAAMANFPTIENTLASFAKTSSMMLRNPSSLSAIFDSIERSKFSPFEVENLETDLTIAVEEFNNVSSPASLAAVFGNLSPLVQAIFLFIILQVLLPQVNSISANFLTPVIESYLQGNNLTNREKVKEIKEIPVYLNDVTTEGLRFITGNNVRLRSEPSTKSEILDELLLGQVVTILSKDRNWIEVTYSYGDGKTMSGWVFTRYTAKFVR